MRKMHGQTTLKFTFILLIIEHNRNVSIENQLFLSGMKGSGVTVKLLGITLPRVLG